MFLIGSLRGGLYRDGAMITHKTPKGFHGVLTQASP